MSRQEQHHAVFSDCIDSLKRWKEMIHKYTDDDPSLVQQMHKVVEGFCLIDFEASAAEKACESVASHIEAMSNRNSQEHIDIDQLYQSKLATIQNGSFNPQQHKIWKEIILNGRTDLDVEEVQREESDNEEMVYEEIQDQVFCSTSAFTPPVDPISKKVIQNAYKNKTCGHIYEHKFILQYIKAMKSKAKCPFIGCGNKNLKLTQLFKDQDTQDKIDNYLNSQKIVNNESYEESDEE